VGLSLDAALETVHARLETFHNLANAAHLVELDLELVDFAQDLAEAGDFGVGYLDGVARAVVLDLRRDLCLLGELGARTLERRQKLELDRSKEEEAHCLPSLLDGEHEAVKVRRQRVQTGGIQEEAALRRGVRSSARRGTALLREGYLLVLAEESDFTLGEA
jgi:hypothetical protein